MIRLFAMSTLFTIKLLRASRAHHRDLTIKSHVGFASEYQTGRKHCPLFTIGSDKCLLLISADPSQRMIARLRLTQHLRLAIRFPGEPTSAVDYCNLNVGGARLGPADSEPLPEPGEIPASPISVTC